LASIPPGEWTTYEIKGVGQQITIKLNGVVVNECTGKLGAKGFVGIQNHDANATVSFRNIRVTELGEAKPAGSAKPPFGSEPQGRRQAADDAPGLVGEYFREVTELDKLKDAKPFLVRVEKNVNVRRGEGQFANSKLATNFGVRWSGVLRAKKDGPHVFTVQSDDDSRVYIDDKLVVEKIKATHEKQFSSEPIELKQGDHAIRVEFTQGAGPAGITLRWQQPGVDKPTTIAPDFLFHAKSAEAIAYDQKAWDELKFDKSQGGPWERMDYGPFLSHTIGAGEGNTALKGIAVKLGKEEGDASVLFDTELLRYAGGWTGGFVNYTGVTFDGSHGPFPTADGEIVFTTKPQPGVREGDTQDFADPRKTPFGPLPREWGRYKGLYRHGNAVTFAYTVGGTEVLESPSIQKAGNDVVFTRTIKLSASDKRLTMALNKFDDAQPVAVQAEGAKVLKIGDSQCVVFPPRKEATTYRVSLTRGETAKAAAKSVNVDELVKAGPAIFAKTIETKGTVGTGDGPYVVDTLTVPELNPYNSWMRFAGLDFFTDGRAAVSTWSGDVWVVSGIDDKLEKLTWKRFASGLFQPLGLKIVGDQIYVLGRDQITRFTDSNNDGEADFYENFNNDVEVSDSFHEFAFDLQTDKEGNFYFAKAGPVRPGGRGWQTLTNHNGTVMKVSKDGSKLEVFATGVRAPNGMGAGPNGEISVADNEGTWTPQCRLSIVKPGGFLGVVDLSKKDTPPTEYDKPICWLPHGEVDNSSGGQVWVPNDKWGPFNGEMLHLSYGKCALFKVLKEDIGDGLLQGGVVQFPLGFESGICRPRFNAKDGQLYVAGLKGWQTTATKDACLQRVRYTGKPVTMPAAMHVAADGISIAFTSALDKDAAKDIENYAVEQWNYLWTSEYGSPEVSAEDPTIKERDPMEVELATLSADGKTIFLKIPDLKPVMQQKIQMKLKGADGKDVNYSIFHTINKLGAPSGGATAAAGK
ncbi:MAG: PA14 domain-containing protein, partial [Planctomycetota bacterium]|nr:PA14 domain-containing protein [Planctomycetota bacterium]